MQFDPDEQQWELTGLDYWRLCDELSIFQAALLIAGIDPSSENAHAPAATSNSSICGQVKFPQGE